MSNKKNEDAKGVFVFEYRPKNNLSKFDLFGEFSTILVLARGIFKLSSKEK